MVLRFVNHSKLTRQDLDDIINLKNKHWFYSAEEHKKWIDENLLNDDIHVLVADDSKVVCYLNLVKLNVIINGNQYPFFGIGNVCSLEHGRGYGKYLLNNVQKFFVENNKSAILFCKDGLLDFYRKFNWILLPRNIVITEKYKNVNMMIFNFHASIYSIEYNDRNF